MTPAIFRTTYDRLQEAEAALAECQAARASLQAELDRCGPLPFGVYPQWFYEHEADVRRQVLVMLREAMPGTTALERGKLYRKYFPLIAFG